MTRSYIQDSNISHNVHSTMNDSMMTIRVCQPGPKVYTEMGILSTPIPGYTTSNLSRNEKRGRLLSKGPDIKAQYINFFLLLQGRKRPSFDTHLRPCGTKTNTCDQGNTKYNPKTEYPLLLKSCLRKHISRIYLLCPVAEQCTLGMLLLPSGIVHFNLRDLHLGRALTTDKWCNSRPDVILVPQIWTYPTRKR